MATVTDIIAYAKRSQYLAAMDNLRGGVLRSKKDHELAKMIYMERRAVEWLNANSTNTARVQKCADYLYALCGKYGTQAKGIVNAGGIVAGQTPTNIFPIYITSANFFNATEYRDSRIVGATLAVFVNEVNRYFFSPAGFTYTPNGIQMVTGGDGSNNIPDFDATTKTYNLIIHKIN